MIAFEVNKVGKEQITLLTEQLLIEVEECYLRFNKTKKKTIQYDFFKQVKPYCDHINNILKVWEKEVIQWIKEERPKYLVTMQIKSIVEHIEHISLQSFYGDSSKKRMKDRKESVIFILNNILHSLKGD